MDFRELVTIRQFRILHEAHFAKGSLDSSGIESFLADDNMVHMDWLMSNLLGGVKLQVAAADAATATEILDTFDNEDVDDFNGSRILPFRKPQKFY